MNVCRPSFFGLFFLTLTLCGSTSPSIMTRGLATAHLAVLDAQPYRP